MYELTRRVRFCVSSPSFDSKKEEVQRPRSAYAGWPTMKGIGTFWEIVVSYRGDVDPQTGYLLNISIIDQAVHNVAIGLLVDAYRFHGQSNNDLKDAVEDLKNEFNYNVRGEPHGKCIWLFENGNIDRLIIYNNGGITEEKRYDEKTGKRLTV